MPSEQPEPRTDDPAKVVQCSRQRIHRRPRYRLPPGTLAEWCVVLVRWSVVIG
jgi:hypothetical protein